MSSSKKILIIHDRFQFRGGAERLVLILAKALNADLMTEFWEPESFEKPSWLHVLDWSQSVKSKQAGSSQGTGTNQNLYILSKGEAPHIVWRYMRAHLSYFFRTYKITKKYDTIIFSGNNCLSASFPLRILELFKPKKSKKKFILYCHSPVRHAFDLCQLNRSEQRKLWKKIIYYNIGAHIIKLIYWLGLKMMNFTIANAENIKKRLLSFSHHKTSQVIYPPIETHKFSWLGQKDYYFSYGRLERLKRIPDIISAFQKMPDKKLIVASGGPDLAKIKAMAKGYGNIKILGWVSDEELKNYLGNCIATFYIPIDEDFGMTPLESNSAGKPCIGVAEGGLLETIIDEKTGKLIPANYTTQDLISAINWMTPEKALSMQKNCLKQAEKFSSERFIREMKEIVYK